MRRYALHRLMLFPLFVLLAWCSATAGAAERVTYFVPDAHGSPVVAMDEQGAVLWRESYAPYGERQTRATANNAKPAYTGKPEDSDTGLVHMGARMYDPEAARFTGIDPRGFSAGNPQSFGRYVYANNNPYLYVDPTGEVAETAWDLFNVGLGIQSYRENRAAGNNVSAAVDAVGIALDSLSAAVPIVPGGAGAALRGIRGLDEAAGNVEISNPVSDTLARVVPGHVDPATLGKPGDADVFVTNASDITGLNAQEIAGKLAIPRHDSFNVIEFPSANVSGIASPINRDNPGFVGHGKTAGGASEFVIPNGPLPAGSTTRKVN